MQQQNYSLEALAKRDAQDDPFGKSQPEPAPPAADDEETKRMQAELWTLKSLNATREALHD